MRKRLRVGRRGDRGSALVESAFVFPVVIILLFGIVEVGYLFRSASMITGASRAGARLASAQYGAAFGNSSQERTVADAAAGAVASELLSKGVTDTPQTLWIYRADANGNTDAGNMTSCNTNCFRYSWNAGTKSWTFVTSSPGWASPDACGQVLDYVGVYIVMRHDPLAAPASLAVRTLERKTVMRLEPRDGCTTLEGPQ